MVLDHPELEDCLFHYTTAGGLIGILSQKKIRATDTAFLNDSSEMSYGARSLEDFLDGQIKKILNVDKPAAGSDARRRIQPMEGFRSFLQDFIEPEYQHLDGNRRSVFDGATYVSCFTEEPNQLSQWRGYGGRGYSIGFTRSALDSLTVEGDDESVGGIKRVGYGPDAINQLCDEVLNYFTTLPFSSLPDGFTNTGQTLQFILPRLARIKHGAFAEEREWRAIVSRYVQWSAAPLRFREGVRLVPYLDLKFDPDAVAWIYIGPGGTLQDKRALRSFLAHHGYDLNRVYIEISDAPYVGN